MCSVTLSFLQAALGFRVPSNPAETSPHTTLPDQAVSQPFQAQESEEWDGLDLLYAISLHATLGSASRRGRNRKVVVCLVAICPQELLTPQANWPCGCLFTPDRSCSSQSFRKKRVGGLMNFTWAPVDLRQRCEASISPQQTTAFSASID